MLGKTLRNSQSRAPDLQAHTQSHTVSSGFCLPTSLCPASPQKGKPHAEILFLDKLRFMELSQVRITCYFTWSPCPNCARQLAAFKKNHPDIILRIYTSRLYFYWRKKFQKGLCSLWRSGIQVDVMDLPRKEGPRPPVGSGKLVQLR